MAYFNKIRNSERSLIFYLRECFNSYWSDLGVTIIKGFSNAYENKNKLPIITIDLDDVDFDLVEIGSTAINKVVYLNLNIFASSDGEKEDIIDFLSDNIKEGCPYVEASYSDPSFGVISTAYNGRLRLKVESSSNVVLGDTNDSKDEHRYYLQVSCRHSSGGSMQTGLPAYQKFTALVGQKDFVVEHVIRQIDDVSLNGLNQALGSDYTYATNIVTLDEPCFGGETVYITYYY
jgi:hypothetical protein